MQNLEGNFVFVEDLMLWQTVHFEAEETHLQTESLAVEKGKNNLFNKRPNGTF